MYPSNINQLPWEEKVWCIAWIHPEGQEHEDKYQGFTCEKAFLGDEMIVK